MSLLMEALKKAEEAKRLAGEGNAPGAAPVAVSELTLQEMTPPASLHHSSTSPLPDLSLHSDSLDADLASVSRPAPNNARRKPDTVSGLSDTHPREERERSTVRNVFSAKQAPTPRTGLWLLLGLAGFVALGIAGYFWWQLQSVSGSSLARPGPALPPTQPLAAVAPQQGPAPATAQTEKPLPALLPPPVSSPSRTAPAPAPTFERATRPPRPSAQAVPDGTLRLSRSQPGSNQTIDRAYDALQAGQLDSAQRDYQQVLRSDANNTDALLGLATIAARQGQAEQAQSFYQRALESDPNNATAQAGLLNTRGQADPVHSESRLKTALASQPDSSALHFALGNLYARQLRWSEAQQAYFRAYSGEPDNADFIFNLAVSLDHLRQNKLAAQYYRMALSAAALNNNSQNISFDRNQVKNRVLELQP
ncbi:MAG: tetratricopeptide repeat protein [Propionivibrio sp.]|uniref:tetratricopeptide repeat protein n=1 Tax=Propionivibrio sp. TaxID=2212460 RepID=UPI001A524187|nr:tetratricopeptide repeat protein [Propionivibrio sp.]MBL8413764.1 tetratricopeptide repeat protein [Propionivibrio sp.]